MNDRCAPSSNRARTSYELSCVFNLIIAVGKTIVFPQLTAKALMIATLVSPGAVVAVVIFAGIQMIQYKLEDQVHSVVQS